MRKPSTPGKELVLISLLLLGGGAVLAVDDVADNKPASLPNPLTLEQALQLVDATSPALMQADAVRSLAVAQADITRSENGFNLSLEGYARYIDPSEIAYDQGEYDHKVSLVMRKNVLDFGHNRASVAASAAAVRGAEWRYHNAYSVQRIAIMSAYFDVLRADLVFARDNEALAVAYVSLDKLRNRHELGQVSDIELLEAQGDYQRVRRQQTSSASNQRLTRARLAIAMGRPGQLPADLAKPRLVNLKRPLPEYDELLSRAMQENPVIQALRAEVDAAQHRMRAAETLASPRLHAEVEASHYSRELGSADPLRAGVVFSVPLSTSGYVTAKVAKQQAETYQLMGQLREAEDDVRQTLLELWLNLDNLRVKQAETRAQLDFRDLYLERSRANYEMEMQTDLGDAMVQLTEAELAILDTDLAIELLWERIDGLVGDKPDEISRQRADTATNGT